MTSLAWFCAGFGVCFGLVVLMGVGIDVLFVEEGVPTISRRCLTVGQQYPVVAVFVTALLVAPVCILIGHLFFGQTPNP